MAARLLCATQWPYLAAGLWALNPLERKGLGTYAVDKWWRMYYDPDLNWKVDELATVLYHEINHLLRDHPTRAEFVQDLDHKAWNICADAEINDDISSEKNCKWPIKPVVPADLKQADNLLAEEYYNALPKLTIKVQSVDCGSCAGGPKRDHEEDGPASKGEGKSKETGITQGEGDLIRHHIANEINAEKTRGTIPEYLKKWAEILLNPKVDWRKVLKASVRHSMQDIAGKTDYSFRRPSRRASCFPGIILPTLKQPVPETAIVIDTSGSMSQEALTLALTEASGVLKSCGVQKGVNVYATDAAVHSAKKVYTVSQITLQGGGGTDMRIGISAALKGKPKPNLVVVFTDGETPWPEEQPPCKLIICLVGENTDLKGCPEYAKVVKVTA
jgi:predicted metal-dependent peptidase